ncbi:lipoyl(octanoyl) transferase LipB [Georgenia yuyongxinii]
MRTMRVSLGTELIDYQEGWDLQRRIHAEVVDGAEDTLILLEHADVYTAGKRTASWDRPTDGTPVVDVDRGGRITWHGPGQLIAYPIVRLRAPIDVVAYVRVLEQAVIDLAAGYGVETVRVPGRSGVWVPADARGGERKLCAVGVRVARGVTMHGIAVNASCDLAAYDRIVPCGIADAGVTSLSAETGRTVSVMDIADATEQQLLRALAQVAPGPSTDRAAVPVTAAV